MYDSKKKIIKVVNIVLVKIITIQGMKIAHFYGEIYYDSHFDVVNRKVFDFSDFVKYFQHIRGDSVNIE
jgi:hypothetical protein